MSARWCLIAESSKAQVYEVESVPEYHFHRVEMLTLESTEFGAPPATQGRGMHHEYDRKNPKHERAAKEFAKRIAAFLEQAHRQGRFDSLIVAADPVFLGFLRDSFRPSVKQAIESEIPRRYRGSVAELERQIMGKLI